MASRGEHRFNDIRVVHDTTKLDFLLDHIAEAIREAVVDVAEEAVGVAKQLAPVRTGELRDSIDYEIGKNGFYAWITADAGHALFVELGTKYVAAQPFMAPAMDLANARLRTRLGEVIEETADKG